MNIPRQNIELILGLQGWERGQFEPEQYEAAGLFIERWQLLGGSFKELSYKLAQMNDRLEFLMWDSGFEF